MLQAAVDGARRRMDVGGGVDDLRSWSVERLATTACAQSADEETLWACIGELQRRGGPEGFATAVEALTSTVPARRAFGANVLGQLGCQTVLEERPFRWESIDRLVAAAATEADPGVVCAITVALCWLQAVAALPWLSSLRTYPPIDLREALACMVPQFGAAQPEAVAIVADLLDDEDSWVRDWASFAFTNQLADAEAPGLRGALHRRVDDADPTTAAQAIHALALRGDRTVLPALARALQHPVDDTTGQLLEAAIALPDPVLLPALRHMQATSDWVDDEDLDALIARLEGA